MPEKSKNEKVVTISSASIIKVILFGLLLVAIYYLRNFVLVLLTSVVIATPIEAAADRLSRWRINRSLAVVIIYIIGLGTLSVIFYLFAPLLIVESSRFLELVSQYFPNSEFFGNLQTGILSKANEVVTNVQTNNFNEFVASSRSIVENLSGGFFGTLGMAFGGILNFILIIIISFYLSIQEKGVQNFLRIVVPLKYEDYAISLWERSQRKIAKWVKGQLLVGLIVGILVYLGLSIFGLENALLLAATAAVFEIIPFGHILAAVPAVALAYLDSGLSLALLVTGFYVIIHEFQVYLIYPLVIRRAIGISPLVVILSLLIGFELGGFWGVVLAIPVAVSLFEFLDDMEKEKAFAKTHA